MLKINKISELKFISKAHGVFGNYYNIDNKIGLKLIRYQEKYVSREYYSYPKLLKAAKLEVRYIKKANKIKLAPKYIELIKIKRNKRFYPAIIMEHISGRHYKNKITDKFLYKTNKMFKKIGLKYGDLHSENVIFLKDGSFRVIDFGPNGISYLKKKMA